VRLLGRFLDKAGPVLSRYYISKVIVRVGRSIAITSPALTIATFKIFRSSPHLFLPFSLPVTQLPVVLCLFAAKLYLSAA
jgi:hypothetical protein